MGGRREEDDSRKADRRSFRGRTREGECGCGPSSALKDAEKGSEGSCKGGGESEVSRGLGGGGFGEQERKLEGREKPSMGLGDRVNPGSAL